MARTSRARGAAARPMGMARSRCMVRDGAGVAAGGLLPAGATALPAGVAIRLAVEGALPIDLPLPPIVLGHLSDINVGSLMF